MVFNVNISKKVYLFITFFVLISGCSSESPDISYQGISAESAVILFNRANNSKEIDGIISRVERDPRYGFDWEEFWRGIRSKTSSLNEEQKRHLFELGGRDCTKTAFNSFAQTVAPFPEYHLYVLSNKSCSESLDTSNLEIYFSHYKSQFSQLSETQILLLNHLLKNAKVDQSEFIRRLMDEVSPKEWTLLIQKSLDMELPQTALDLVQTYGDIYGANGLVEVVFVPMTEDQPRFSSFLKLFGFTKTLDFLLMLPRNLFLSDLRTALQWEEILGVLGQEFLRQTYTDWTFSSATSQAYRDYEKLQLLMNHLETKVSLVSLLSAYDFQTRHMEKIISTAAADFFMDVPKTYISLWLEYRITGKLKGLSVDSSVFSSGLLDQLHAQRLKVHFEEEPTRIHAEVLKLCELYAQFEIPEKKISSGEFQREMLLKPGCLVLKNDDFIEPLELKSQEELKMSMSSVLITSGLSLLIEAPQLDGSVIDLSATSVHPDLPIQNPSDEDHASVFPVVMGFQVKTETETFSQGIYYIVTHYTAHTAAAGRASQTPPLKGASGGDLWLRLSNEQASFMPQIVSEGGLGQKAVPVTVGGRKSVSLYSWDSIQKNLLSTTSVSGDFSLDRRLLSRPSISKIRELWSIAEKKSDGSQDVIATFVDSKSWWESLNDDQKNKILRECENATFNQDCAMELAEKAALQLQSEIAQISSEVSGSFIPPRLALLEYEEPAGALGPINLDGAQGAPGTIKIEVAK